MVPEAYPPSPFVTSHSRSSKSSSGGRSPAFQGRVSTSSRGSNSAGIGMYYSPNLVRSRRFRSAIFFLASLGTALGVGAKTTAASPITRQPSSVSTGGVPSPPYKRSSEEKRISQPHPAGGARSGSGALSR